MYEAQSFYYNRQLVRTVQVDDSRWWALCDVSKILGYDATYQALNLLGISEKQITLVRSKEKGVSRLYIVPESGLNKVIDNAKVPEASDFKRWVTFGVPAIQPPIPKVNEVKIDEVQTTPAEEPPVLKEELVKTKNKSSVEVALQKASILVRMSEHKALPQSEQLRLLDMALKELTDAGLSLSSPTGKSVIEKIADATQDESTQNIMALPEVKGVLNKNQRLKTDIATLYLHPVKNIAFDFGVTVDKFDEFATKANLKNGIFGSWVMVLTNQGTMAREYAYTSAAIELYRVYVFNVKNRLPTPF